MKKIGLLPYFQNLYWGRWLRGWFGFGWCDDVSTRGHDAKTKAIALVKCTGDVAVEQNLLSDWQQTLVAIAGNLVMGVIEWH